LSNSKSEEQQEQERKGLDKSRVERFLSAGRKGPRPQREVQFDWLDQTWIERNQEGIKLLQGMHPDECDCNACYYGII